MSDILEFARRYVAGDVSIVPIRTDGTKRPSCDTWKPFQDRLPTDEELRAWFGNCAVRGLAGIGGRVSRNLEVIDVDDQALIAPFMEAVNAESPWLLEEVCQHETPRPGAQFLFRCSEIETPGNTKLAQSEPRPVCNEETGEPEIDQKTGKQRWAPKTLIETRGEGGYFLLPGSPAKCHKTGRLYRHVAGPAIHELRDISAADRDVLFRAARQFNLYVDDEDERDAQARGGKRRDDLDVNRDAAGSDGAPRGGLRPGDDYNQRASWDMVLEPHGWRHEKSTGALTHWTRPGKETGTSATTGAVSKGGNDLFCVFSSNAHPFEGAAGGKPCSSYSKFAAYALLNHGGDFDEATKALAAEGYGDQQRSGGGQAFTGSAGGERLTDVGNCRRLVARHGQDLRYCFPWNSWLVWDTMRWARDDTAEVERRAKDTARQLYHDATNAKDDDLRKKLVQFAAVSEKRERIASMIALARSEPGIPVMPADLDRDVWMLNCVNGTLDLRTGELLPHRPGNMITKLCPTKFNADAPSYSWDRFIETTFAGNQTLIDFVQRLCGYFLTGSTREQLLPVFWGDGSNGKSTLIDAVLKTLGRDYSHQAPRGFLLAKKYEAHPAELVGLFGMRFVAAVETGEGRALDEATVKMLTGSDRIRARDYYEKFFEFDPTHKIVLATNHRPAIKGQDDAIWRRIALVPFDVRFWDPDKGQTGPEELRADKTLPDRLEREAEGILRWMVEGAAAWQRHGLAMPQEVLAATGEYRRAEDVVQQWIDECCVLGAAVKTKGGDLFVAFEKWCRDRGAPGMSGTKFGRVLERKGFAKEKNSCIYRSGIGIRADF